MVPRPQQLAKALEEEDEQMESLMPSCEDLYGPYPKVRQQQKLSKTGKKPNNTRARQNDSGSCSARESLLFFGPSNSCV